MTDRQALTSFGDRSKTHGGVYGCRHSCDCGERLQPPAPPPFGRPAFDEAIGAWQCTVDAMWSCKCGAEWTFRYYQGVATAPWRRYG